MIKVERDKVLITPADIAPSSESFEILGTLNPAAARLPNGNIVLYVRVIEKLIENEDKKYYYSPRCIGKEKYRIKLDRFRKNLTKYKSDLDFIFKDGTKRLTFISHLRRVILDKSGFKIKSIEDTPSFYGLSWDGELGIEDGRITKINDLYVMTYVSLSRTENISTSYAVSNDCINWYRRGVMFGEQDKDVVLFPERINGLYYAFDRPEGSFQFSLPRIWINSSKDLELWGRSKPIVLSKEGDTDFGRKGAGPPPIKTDKGWLLIYHSVKEVKKIKKDFIRSFTKALHITKDLDYETVPVYTVNAALFDLKNPHKLTAKSKHPILIPKKIYERTLENKFVIFPTGIVPHLNGKDILLFSGAGDRATTVKRVSLSEIMETLEEV